ncbi:MAG: protein kinase [Gammaproteobacteria bacterium]|nr:protein kinase [Gammaproteobacteria bacterium]
MSNESHSNETIVVKISYPEIADLDISGTLGKGGSGTVYKGHQPFLKRDVAVKVLNITNNTSGDDFIERFHREVQILASLIHPNIVTCFQAGMTQANVEHPSSPYLVMEYVNGDTLHDWINEHGVIDSVTALNIIEKIAGALDYAHKKSIIHRDIKAENILLQPLENDDTNTDFNFMPKLADLGIARSTQKKNAENLTVVGTMIGTPSSMAPEQFNDPDNVDFKVDIYGLGCVLFHMVTGKKPYNGENLTDMVIQKNSAEGLNPRDLNKSLNKNLSQLIMNMMAARPEKRPASYTEIIEQCQTISQHLAKKNKKGKQKTTQSSIGLVFALVIVAVALYLFVPWNSFLEETLATSSVKNNSVISSETIKELPLEKIEKTTSKPRNQLQIRYADKNDVLLASGEAFSIMLITEQDAFAYCYFEDQKGEIFRFFPNRFNGNPFISKEAPLILPGESGFNLNASTDGVSERLACFSTIEDITNILPEKIVGTDFEALPVESLESIKRTYQQVSENEVSDAFFDIRVF